MKIGLVFNWPGSKNSELDIIGRIKHILEKDNIESYIIDPFGQLLNNTGNYIDPRQVVNENALDFVLNLHYSSPNFLDVISYFANWNPIEYLRKDPPTGNIISHDQELYIADCMRSHDIALQAGSDILTRFYHAINICNPAFTEKEEFNFFTTCQYVSDIDPVTLENPRIFYIGINWERLAAKTMNDARHGGLLEKLDKTGFTDFYGVSKLRNMELWEGFKNYYGELPFDYGSSIIRKSNECGISLVLSSRAHHNSELISTRIFQACAARTVIISDDNPFIQKHFGDSVLYINFGSDTESNFRQISDAYNWIKSNPDLAKNKAEKSHQIFREKFTLEKQIENLITYHRKYVKDKESDPLNSEKVDVIWISKSPGVNDIKQFVSNLNKQKYIKVFATIITESECENAFKSYLKNNALFDYRIHIEEKFTRPCGFYLKKYIYQTEKGGYLCIYSINTEWSSTHLGQMSRILQSRNESIAQAGGCIKNNSWQEHYHTNSAIKCTKNYFHPINILDITKFLFENYCPSTFLFKKELLDKPVINVISNLDDAYWFALIVSSYLASKKTPIFIPKISIRVIADSEQFQFPRTVKFLYKNYDRRFLHLCYNYHVESREVFGIEKLLRGEIVSSVSVASFKNRILGKFSKKEDLYNRVAFSFFNLLFKYL